MRITHLLAELKRRRVYRVAAAYVVASFTLLEAADLILPALPTPVWLYRALVLVVLAGFPVVVVLSWIFDITPEGVRRDGAPGPDDGEAPGAWAGRPLVFGTILVGLVGVGAWLAGRRTAGSGPPAPEAAGAEGTLAILPFTSATPDSTLERLGRDLVITLSASLAATADVPTVEALSVLAQVPPDEGPLPLRRAAEAAASLGAPRMLYGSLVETGGELALDVTLYETDGIRRLGTERVEADGIDALTDSATLAILRLAWKGKPSAPPSPGAISTGSPAALKAYLEGERAIAENRWREAPDGFRRAIAADSSFWYAYWRLEYALRYHGSPVDSLVEARVWEHRDALPAQDRLMVEAEHAPIRRRLEILRYVTNRFPTYWPGWWGLSERLVHDGGYLGHTLAESRAALERTLDLNPRFVPAWSHLFWIASRSRDAAEMERIIQELAGARYDQISLQEAGINTLTYYRVQEELVAAPDEVPADVVETGVEELSAFRGPADPEGISSTLMRDGFLAAQVGVSRGLLESPEALPPMKRAQHFVLAHALAGLGDWDGALEAADAYAADASVPVDLLLPYRIAVVGAWLGALDPSRADARRPRRLESAPWDGAEAAEIAWLDGILASARQDGEAVSRARAALRTSEGPWRAVLDRSLDAHESAATGDAAAARKLTEAVAERDGGALSHAYAPAHPFLDGVDRLSAVRWLLANGDTLTARRLLPWYEVVLPGSLYRLGLANQVLATPALRVRAELARAARRDDRAEAFEALLRERRSPRQ